MQLVILVLTVLTIPFNIFWIPNKKKILKALQEIQKFENLKKEEDLGFLKKSD